MADVFATTRLIRLDAGWNLPSDLPLPPITTRPVNFDAILNVFQTKSLAPLITRVGVGGLTERNVYRFMFLTAKKRNMNWEVSRYQFHCFARYASQRGLIFDMGRDGKLQIVQVREGPQRGTVANVRGSRRGGEAVVQGGPAAPRRSGGDTDVARPGGGGRGDDAVSYAGTTMTQFINNK